MRRNSKMGDWCNRVGIGPTAFSTDAPHLKEIFQEISAEFDRSGFGYSDDAKEQIRELFGVTVASAVTDHGPAILRNGGRDFVLKHVRRIARHAEQLARKAGTETIRAVDILQATTLVVERARKAESRLRAA